MTTQVRFASSIAVGAFAIVAALIGANAHAIEVGQNAPCVELLQVYPDGSETEQCIREKTGAGQKFTVIEFFSIDCSDCAQNLPIVSQLSTEIVKTTQSRIVSIDKKEDRVRQYIADHKDLVKFPVAFDLDRDAKKAYGVVSTPTTFLLDNSNKVVFKHEGILEAKDLDQIKALVK